MEIVINHESIRDGWELFGKDKKSFSSVLKKFLDSIIVYSKFNCNTSLDFDKLKKSIEECIKHGTEKKEVLGHNSQILRALQSLKGCKLSKMNCSNYNSNIEYRKKILLSNELINENNSFMKEVIELAHSSEEDILLFNFPNTNTNDFGYIPYIRKNISSRPILNFYPKSNLIPSKLIKILTTNSSKILFKYLVVNSINNSDRISNNQFEKIIGSDFFKKWLESNNSKWNPLKSPLPHKKLSNLLCTNTSDWKVTVREKNGDSSNAEIARSKEMFHLVALMNGYRYDQKLSRLNSTKSKNRLIYSSENCSLKERIHLSLDMEKFGVFEKCNYKGEHLGEFNFGGKKTAPADPGGHSIKIKN